MAVEFEFAPVPMPSGRPKKLRYYPRVVNRRTVSTPDIVKEIEMACTLTRTDVVAVLDALNRSLVGWLKDGWRVHIDGIGYFDVSLTAPETRNPKDTRASSVKFKNVQKGEFEKNRIIHEIQKEEDSKKEFMLLGLRKIDGIKISEFKNKFGDNPIYLYRNELKKLSDEKLIIIQDDNIRLSNKGIDLANLVWEEFVQQLLNK